MVAQVLVAVGEGGGGTAGTPAAPRALPPLAPAEVLPLPVAPAEASLRSVVDKLLRHRRVARERAVHARSDATETSIAYCVVQPRGLRPFQDQGVPAPVAAQARATRTVVAVAVP